MRIKRRSVVGVRSNPRTAKGRSLSSPNKHKPTTSAQAPIDERDIGAMEALWAFFSSMKTAIVLLLFLAAASVLGTLLEDRKGVTLYGSSFYKTLLALVGINLTVCSLNRFKLVWRQVFGPVVVTDRQHIAGMAGSVSLTTPGQVDSVSERIAKALRSRRYKVTSAGVGSDIAIHAVRGRAGFWGPHVTHLSLLVIFASAIYGHFLGTDGYAPILETERTTGYYRRGQDKLTPLGFEVELRNFTIEFDGNHNPTGYKSDVRIHQDGREVHSKVVDVNHPLTWQGISFYQSDYGLNVLSVVITGLSGKSKRLSFTVVEENTPQGRRYVIKEMGLTEVELDGRKLHLLVHNLVPDYVGGEALNRSLLPLNPAVEVMINDRWPQYKGLDAWQRLGWMTEGKSARFKGYNVTIERFIFYSGLQVARNPGLPGVYAGFALMILGILLSFYVTHKTIRVHLTPAPEGVSVALGTTQTGNPDAPDRDIQHLVDSLSPQTAESQEGMHS
jgi:cytochrome c biogenesis protein